MILLVIVLTTTAFSSYSKSLSYQANISVSMSYNNPKLVSINPSGLVDGYTASLESLSKFLEARLNSPEIQQLVGEKMGAKPIAYSHKSPFYKTTNTGAGSASLSLESSTKSESEKFITGVQSAIQRIEDEWNNQRTEEFKVSHRELMLNPIVEVSKSVQLQILPTFVGLLVGIVLTLVIPQIKKS